MAYLLCQDCGISFRKYEKPMFPGDRCVDCGGRNTSVEEDDEI